MFKKLGMLAAIVLILSGCATQPTWTPLPYNEAEYAPYKKKGTGIVKGDVFAKTVGGDVKKGSGSNVYLMPATTFGDQRYKEAFVNGAVATVDADPRHGENVKKVQADIDGKFQFTEITTGKYYVFSSVFWEIQKWDSILGRYYSVRTGGNVIKQIDVTNGKTTEVSLFVQ